METLFRFQVLRAPVLPDPRYPPIKLAQSSPFQDVLARAANDSTDPRKEMADKAKEFLSDPAFVDIDREAADNLRIDKASNLIETRVQSSGDSTDASMSRPKLLQLLSEALEQDVLIFARADGTNDLLSRLKDSIVAIREVHFESPSHMEILALRLRLVDFVQKLPDDENFPLNDDDIKSWWRRTLLAPTLADLQSILSTAQSRNAARAAFFTDLNLKQNIAIARFTKQATLRNALSELRAVPSHQFRRTAAPVAIARVELSSLFSNDALQARNLQILNTFADLNKRHYDLLLNNRFEERFEQRGDTSHLRCDTSSALPIQGDLQPVDTAGLSSLVDMSKFVLSERAKLVPDSGTPGFEPLDNRVLRPTLTKEAADLLTRDTKEALQGHNIDPSTTPVAQMIRILETDLSGNASVLDQLYKQHDETSEVSISRVGNTMLRSTRTSMPRWHESLATAARAPIFAGLRTPSDSRIPNSKGKLTIASVYDLLVVKQQLIGYEGADVAHIKSVLLNEKESRELTTRREIEVYSYTETETTEEESSERSTIERFEASDESEKTIKQDEAIKAGLTLSGSYGPTVKMSVTA
jgi:hypothetical protein